MSNGLKSIQENLKIKVVDTVPPVIVLNKDEATLTRDENGFVPEDYIKELSDNCDPDPNLTVGRLDWELDEQDVRYVVSDTSGNRTIVKLHVLIEDKPKPKPQSSCRRLQTIIVTVMTLLMTVQLSQMSVRIMHLSKVVKATGNKYKSTFTHFILQNLNNRNRSRLIRPIERKCIFLLRHQSDEPI